MHKHIAAKGQPGSTTTAVAFVGEGWEFPAGYDVVEGSRGNAGASFSQRTSMVVMQTFSLGVPLIGAVAPPSGIPTLYGAVAQIQETVESGGVSLLPVLAASSRLVSFPPFCPHMPATCCMR